MKKAAILFLLIISSSIRAQQKNEFTLQAGNNLSLHDLRLRPYNNSKILSFNDFGISILYNHKIKGHLYFSTIFNLSILETDKKDIVKYWQSAGVNLKSAKGGTYKMFNFLCGLKYYIIVGEKFNLASSLRGGIVKMNVSDIVFTDDYLPGYTKESYNFKNTWSVNSDIEFTYLLSKTIGLTFDVSYLSQKFKYDYKFDHEYGNNQYYNYGIPDKKMIADQVLMYLGLKYCF